MNPDLDLIEQAFAKLASQLRKADATLHRGGMAADWRSSRVFSA